MTLWQVLTVTLVAWISGALFGVGIKELKRKDVPTGAKAGAAGRPAPEIQVTTIAVDSPGPMVAAADRVLAASAFHGFTDRLREQSKFKFNLQALALNVGQPSKRRFGIWGYWLEALIALMLVTGVGWSVYYFAINVKPPEADHIR